jgi:dTMP kinase
LNDNGGAIMGKLIVFEGVDGSGKSTQVRLLYNWLRKLGYDVVLTKWLSGKFARHVLDKSNYSNMASYMTGTHIIATDFAWRLESIVIPALKTNKIVICDRYIYTPLTREVLRGIDEQYIRQLYSFAPKENLTFYFDIDSETAYERKSRSNDITFFESALDLYDADSISSGLNCFTTGEYSESKIRECFIKFQGELILKYKRLPEYSDFNVINSYNSCKENFNIIKQKSLSILGNESILRNKLKLQSM